MKNSNVIARKQKQRILEALSLFPAVVVTGARQVGKSTLAMDCLPGATYLSLDLPSQADRAQHNAPDFLAGLKEPAIIDEIQYAPELFRHLKLAIDAKRTPGRFLLTGSQTFSLMAGVSESLAGRVAVLSLFGLSSFELNIAPSDQDRLLWRGGFPELWQKPEMPRELWMSSYVATYLERDVRQIVQVGNLRDFDRFMRACALRAGQLLSYSDLARDVGVAPNTIKSWISILEASHQIFLLEPYFKQGTKRLVKSPKLYFHDTGLLLFLLGFQSMEDVVRHVSWGAIWENFVIAEIWKLLHEDTRRMSLWFWRTSQGDEVDLLIEEAPQRFLAIESKAAERVNASAFKGCRALAREYGSDTVTGAYIVCRTQVPYPVESSFSGAMALPLLGPDGMLGKLVANELLATSL